MAKKGGASSTPSPDGVFVAVPHDPVGEAVGWDWSDDGGLSGIGPASRRKDHRRAGLRLPGSETVPPSADRCRLASGLERPWIRSAGEIEKAEACTAARSNLGHPADGPHQGREP